MAQNKRLSVSSARSVAVRSPSPISVAAASTADTEEWTKAWQDVLAKDLIDSPVEAVDADTTVEDACELLLSKGLTCLAVRAPADNASPKSPYIGLFDFADVNAFLTLAASRHTFHPDYLRDNPRVEQILEAAKSGPDVPIHLVTNLSEKNPLEILPHDATSISLLGVFCRGTHRALISAEPPFTEFLGFVSDRNLLSWFFKHAQETPSFLDFISTPINAHSLPSINLFSAVVATTSTATVLDAMRLMSEQGVSSIAVVEEEGGSLHSAISVTDIGKVVVPAKNPQMILSTPLHQMINMIKEPYGATDGNEIYPVYSVSPYSPLSYSIEKLLATNSHRLFVTSEANRPTSPTSGRPNSHICGIVSIVDILSLFARIANVPDVDPTRMQRHRRASSASSHSSRSSVSGNDVYSRSRSGSRTSVSSPRTGTTSLEGSFVWAERVPLPGAEKK